ncbi:16S rRNA (cytosine(1402)-N(4))-methyltransferase RsmH [Patescibacteria group bacterium]|nr:16S rRNA (cytosine(1402)-N(4))-methyltransferase RsmH [Patescibacteria group bacterium]
MQHITVLQDEAVEGLALIPQSTVIDATLGSAGHARAICAQLGKRGVYLGIDADQSAVEAAAPHLSKVAPKVSLAVGNFKDLTAIAHAHGIRQVDGILADLGWRMEQFTDGKKGFSFQVNEPLLMTFGDPAGYLFTAHDVINEWSEEQIAMVIYGYGEERYSRQIAKAVVAARQTSAINTTLELVDIIRSAVPAAYRRGRINPATKTFQALRMVVNDELTVLEAFIQAAVDLLAPEGRLAIITFHSIEDRIVKHTFRSLVSEGVVELVTKRPIVPTAEEVKRNPRSRSAKLRIITKLPLL